jgi:hypothetical protein
MPKVFPWENIAEETAEKPNDNSLADIVLKTPHFETKNAQYKL